MSISMKNEKQTSQLICSSENLIKILVKGDLICQTTSVNAGQFVSSLCNVILLQDNQLSTCSTPSANQFVSSPCVPGTCTTKLIVFITVGALGSNTVLQNCNTIGSSVGYVVQTNCVSGSYNTVGSQTVITCSSGYFGSAVCNSSSCSGCSQCSSGYYSSPNQSTCTICNAGSSSSTDQSSCTKCSQGYYNPTAGGICLVCSPGTYSSSIGATSCTSCGTGFWSSSGASSCSPIACTSTGYSLSSSSICQCSAGYYGTVIFSSGTYAGCQICGAGYYCSGGGSRTSCIAGTYSTVTTATSSSTCLPCADGYWSDAGQGSACTTFCGVGYYCTGGVKTSCQSGTYSTSTTASSISSCINCAEGTFSTAVAASSSTTCVNCAPGYWSTSGSSSTCQTVCGAGFFCNNGLKTGCSPGTYSSMTTASTISTCNACAAGTYSPSIGATTASACLSCSIGYYSAASSGFCSAISCSRVGFTGTAGSCICALGYTGSISYSNGTPLGCNPCGGGSYCSNNLKSYCPAGTWSSNSTASNISTCNNCPEGSFSSAIGGTSMSVCLACQTSPTVQWSTAGSSSCTDISCSVMGYSGTSGLCFCAPGYIGTVTYSNGVPTGCNNCGKGYYCTGNTSPQIGCQAGTYSTSTNASTITTCLKCSSGTWSSSIAATSSSTCLPCADGYWSDAGQGSACTTFCGVGYYCTGGVKTSCQSGTYSTSTTASSISSCINCAEGTFSTALAASSSTTCVNCAPGYWSTSGSSSTCQTVCGAGFFCNNGLKTGCSPGTYSSMTTASNISTCVYCSGGYWSDTAQGSSCTIECGQGNYCQNGEKKQCGKGTYSTSTTASSSSYCTLCKSGTFSSTIGATNSSFCLPCLFGYSSLSGASSCTSIACQGSYTGASGNCSCSQGYFGNVAYVTTETSYFPSGCQNCGEGFFCLGGVNRNACPIGTYSNATNAFDNTTCTYCEKGTYGDTPGLGSCSNCPYGTWSYSPGASSLSECIPIKCNVLGYTGNAGACVCDSGYFGKIFYSNGVATNCTICPKGNYCPINQNIGATQCVAGSYLDSTGNSVYTSCISCEPGFYSVAGSSICSPCEIGSYAPNSNTIVCTPCTNVISNNYFVTILCTPTDDLIQRPCSSPKSKHYVKNVCNSGSNITVGSDTTTLICSSPTYGQYVKAKCISGASNVQGFDTFFSQCDEITSLNLNTVDYYISVVCSGGDPLTLGSNTVFANCTNPNDGFYVTDICYPGEDASSTSYSLVGVNSLISPCPQPYIPPNSTVSVPPLWVSAVCESGDRNNVGKATVLTYCSNSSSITPGYFLNTSANCIPGNYYTLGRDFTSELCPSGFSCAGFSEAPNLCPSGGYVCESGTITPNICPLNHYCPSTSQIFPCNPNQSSPTGRSSVKDCVCNSGFYRDFYNAYETNCTICPFGATCQGYNLITGYDAPPVAIPGYVASHDIAIVTQCLPSAACSDGETTIYDVWWSSQSTSSSARQGIANVNYNQNTHSDVCLQVLGRPCMPLCSSGYNGANCGACVTEGKLKAFRSMGLCDLCSTQNAWDAWGLMLLLFFNFCLCVYMFYKLNLDYRIIMMTITVIQIVASFGAINLQWSSIVKAYFNIASSVNANIDLVHAECYQPLDYQTKWLLIQVIPPIVISIITLLFIFYKLVFNSLTRYLQLRWKPVIVNWNNWFYYVITALDIFFFPMTTNTLKIFDCVKLSDGQQALSISPDIICDVTLDRTYASLHYVAMISIVIYVIGIPLLFSAILFYYRKEIREDLIKVEERIKISSSPKGIEDKDIIGGSGFVNKFRRETNDSDLINPSFNLNASTRDVLSSSAVRGHAPSSPNVSNWGETEKVVPNIIRLRFGCLYRAYSSEFFYWKLVILSRKFLIIYVITMFSNTQPTFQALTVIVVLQFSALLQYYARPYLPQPSGLNPLNAVEFFTLLSTTIILSNGVLMNAVAEKKALTTDSVAAATLQFRLDFLTILTCFLITILILIYLFIIFRYGTLGLRGQSSNKKTNVQKKSNARPDKMFEMNEVETSESKNETTNPLELIRKIGSNTLTNNPLALSPKAQK